MTQIDEAKKLMRMLLEKNSSLKSEIEDLKDDISSLDEELSSLRKKYKELENSKKEEEKTTTRSKPIESEAIVDKENIVKHYVFATTSEKNAEDFKNFILKCINGKGEEFKLKPEIAAVQVGISSKAKDTFIDTLKKFTINDTSLIKNINGIYYSLFSADEIIDFLFKEI